MFSRSAEAQSDGSALMKEAASASETSVNFYRTTRRYDPDDSHLRALQRIENDNIKVDVNEMEYEYVNLFELTRGWIDLTKF
jgi:hypothetical protein